MQAMPLPVFNHNHNHNNQLRAHAKKFLQPQCSVNAYLYSFFPQAIKLWNHLPQELTA